MNREPSVAARPPAARSPRFVGTLYGIVSALAYTLTDILLRELAEHNDPVWTSCMKAVPTLGIAGGLLLWQASRRSLVLPTRRLLAMIIGAGLIVQVGGNAMFQWALGAIGLALSVPLCFGTLIVGGAMMGRTWLGEPITNRSAAGMTLLVLSVAILGLGAPAASARIQATETTTLALPATRSALLGVAAAGVSGVAYALSSVVIRGATRSVPISVTLGLISGSGVLGLGLITIGRLGLSGILATEPQAIGLMLLAGLVNALGFFTLGKSLQLVPVAYANAVNASQAAMAAVCGIVIFREASNWSLVVGVVLTIVGLVIMRDRPQAADEPPL